MVMAGSCLHRAKGGDVVSLLNYTAGTPGRVFALLRLIRHLGEQTPVSRQLATSWMAEAGIRTREGTSKGRPKEGMEHTCSFAHEAKLLEGPPEGPWRTNTNWVDVNQMADAVHEYLAHLTDDDDNSIVLGAYAILLMYAELEGHFGWGVRLQKQVANELNDRVMAWRNVKSGNLISDEKLRTWEDWIGGMGLLMPEATLLPYAPYPLERMRREINLLSGRHGANSKIPARQFWDELTDRMPYLDDGRLWNSIRSVLGVSPFASTLSYPSSICLHQLAEEGVIEFELVPDSQLGLRLKNPDRAISIVKLCGSKEN
jgi:hypothetical protein